MPKFLYLIISIIFISCEAPIEQAPLDAEADQATESIQNSDDPLDEKNYQFLNISINGVSQELINTDEFVGCKRTHGSQVLDINISGDQGQFLGKNGRFEVSFPLVKELFGNEYNLFSDAYNPIGMPLLDFIAEDAPSEFLELPIGIVEVPQVTHSLVSLYNDPEVKPNCSIEISQRGSVLEDFGKSQAYGVRWHYREFEIKCSNYIVKDQLKNQFLDLEINELQLNFNCKEVVYY